MLRAKGHCSRESASSPLCSLCCCICLFVKLSNASFHRPQTKRCHKLEFCRILKRSPSSPLRVLVLKVEPSDTGEWEEMCWPGGCYHFSMAFSFKFGKEGADLCHTEVNVNHQLVGLTLWIREMHFATQVALIISSMVHVGSVHRLDEMLSSNLQGVDISILKWEGTKTYIFHESEWKSML